MRKNLISFGVGGCVHSEIVDVCVVDSGRFSTDGGVRVPRWRRTDGDLYSNAGADINQYSTPPTYGHASTSAYCDRYASPDTDEHT